MKEVDANDWAAQVFQLQVQIALIDVERRLCISKLEVAVQEYERRSLVEAVGRCCQEIRDWAAH